MHRNIHIRKFIFLASILCIQFLPTSAQSVVISEFMAINNKFLADDDGEYSDWIELNNQGNTAINLEGWFLTDNADRLSKWMLPAIILQPGEFLIVFASEKSRREVGGIQHSNFKLSGSGEFLALVEPDMKTIAFSYGESYPVQRENVSYGFLDGEFYFFQEPTPGKANRIGNQTIAPIFSKERGFYNDAFELTLTSSEAISEIYYTIDGTRPDATTGIRYAKPISISTTTPVSAVAKSESGYSEIITHTYLFINDIAQQPNNPVGYPSEWSPLKFKKENAPADYEMDPEVCLNPSYKDLIDDALLAIPSVCVVTNIGYLFSHEKNNNTGGIYIYTGNTSESTLGIDWERAASVEYIDPVLKKSFQLNCGLKLHGGNSRVPDNSQKHSFRISFRGDYGPTKLNYNLFDTRKPTNEFNNLVLRAGYNYSWTKNDPTQRKRADYIRDPFAKNTQLDMGNPSAHSKFVHLYLNGLYWGVYNLSEKINNDFIESYMGGKEEDWDVVKDHSGLVDGSVTTWNKLVADAKATMTTNSNYFKLIGLDSNGKPSENVPELLDVDNFIDYMIHNIYMGNKDWDGNNWLAARNRVNPEHGFRFFAWDTETSMISVTENIVNINNAGNPSAIYTNLRKNSEFALRFADRLQKHFFNGGALTPEAVTARYKELADEIDLAIIAESARWGDYRKDVQPSDTDLKLYTRNDFWLPEVAGQLKEYLPKRSDIVLAQFKSAGLFPNLSAPVFSHYGGKIESAIDLAMTASDGDIYYTTDGTDPREVGGTNSLSALKYSAPLQIAGKGTIKARAKKGTGWSAVTTAKFKSDDTTQFVVNVPSIELAINSNCYPNPFAASTNIRYSIPSQGVVCVAIYSFDGRRIETLYQGEQKTGTYTVTWNATAVKNGLFFYRVQWNGITQTGKMILTR